MVRVGDEKILVIPSNVVIEKLVKEPEAKEETPTISEPMEEYNEEDENQQWNIN